MNVPRDPRPSSLPNIHSQIDSIRMVELAQHRLHPLRKADHLVRGFGRQFLQFVQMRVRHDHHVPGRIRIRIQNDEAMLAAMNNISLGVVFLLWRIAEHASGGLFRGRDVGIPPRRPQIIHSRAG